MSEPVSRSRRRRRFIAAAVLLLILLIVVPPFINVNQFRRTIVHSISAGLGRPVEASAVELQVFPRPGFVLHNLTVGEDPAYGAEPVMTAETVTAGLRASTLWHRRVEIATLRFDAPSVNLVRDANGNWNFESLLRNSPALHSHGAAASGRPSRRMPFPYVEATEARINFKLGAEKLPFSLERANLAVWKESAHEWRLRIRADPVRTDLSVDDAGQIRGEGRLITGGPLIDAPIRGNLEWRRVELGEISRLLHGEDDGWRGTVDWTVQARGKLSNVSLTSDIAVEEFRRAEFIPANEMDLSAHCQARYARYSSPLDSLACDAPVGEGHVWLRAFGALKAEDAFPVVGGGAARVRRMNGGSPLSLRHPGKQAGPRVQIALQQVPAEFLLDLLGHIHPGVAADASTTGEVNGDANCEWHPLRMPRVCTGEIRATEVRLQLAHMSRPLALSPLLIESGPAAHQAAPVDTIWKLSPAHISLGAATPALVTGSMSAAGASLEVTGSADLAELRRLAQSLKIPAISGEVQSLRGSAQLALTLESTWLAGSDMGGFSTQTVPSRWLGSVQLHDATLRLALLPVPIELASGQIDLTSTGVEWTGLNGTFAHIPFDGSIQWQTPCATSNSTCARSFDLHTSNLSAEHLQAALRNGASGSDLLSLINPWAGGIPQLPEISGTFSADVLSAGRISLKDAALQLRLKGQSAELMSISGKVFGGTVSGMPVSAIAPGGAVAIGTGSVHWGDGAPTYVLRVNLEHIQPDHVGAIWHEHWGGGVANTQIDLKTQGWSAGELAQNARGKFAIDWANGILPGATATPPIWKFQRWNANGTIRDQTLVLNSGQIIPENTPQRRHIVSPQAQAVTGTVTFARVLDLRLEPSGTSITGPLGIPVAKSLNQ